MFAGFVILDDPIRVPFQVTNLSRVPLNADALPTYRIYGQSGAVASGTCEFADSGAVAGASNASPIVITSANHGLTTGTRVTVAGVGGNSAANGNFTVTRIDANTFSLQGSAGNGAYTSGGTWNASGLYQVSLDATEANGFDQDSFYTVAIDYLVSASPNRDLAQFGVI